MLLRPSHLAGPYLELANLTDLIMRIRVAKYPCLPANQIYEEQFLARVKELVSSVTILDCLMMLLTLTALYCLESPPEAPMQPSQPRLLQNDLRQDSYVNFSVAVPMNSLIIGSYTTISAAAPKK